MIFVALIIFLFCLFQDTETLLTKSEPPPVHLPYFSQFVLDLTNSAQLKIFQGVLLTDIPNCENSENILYDLLDLITLLLYRN